jgi:hypothetical protein
MREWSEARDAHRDLPPASGRADLNTSQLGYLDSNQEQLNRFEYAVYYVMIPKTRMVLRMLRPPAYR